LSIIISVAGVAGVADEAVREGEAQDAATAIWLEAAAIAAGK
jgi:hypothetical protein